MEFEDMGVGLVPHNQPSWNRLTPETWALIKVRYRDGESAAALAQDFRISESIIRKRAQADGWRRSDQADPKPDAPATLDELARDGRPNFSVMADTAMRRAARAVAEGRLSDAMGWTRVGRSLTAAARRERPRSADA